MDPLIRPVKPIRRRALRKPLSQEVYWAYRSLVATLFILGVGTSGAFLYINSLKPAQGYHLEELQANYEDLQSDQRHINQQIIEAQSFINLNKSKLMEHMQAISQSPISYVQDSGLAQASSRSNTP